MHDAADPIVVGAVPFQVSSLDQATDWAVAAASSTSRAPVAVRLSNSYCVALASVQRPYRRLLTDGAGVNFPDGLPVVVAMRLLRKDGAQPQRVRGPSLFRLVLQHGVSRDIGHFFLGSSPETLVALERAARAIDPRVRVVGTYSPPYADLDERFVDDLVDKVRGRGADIVWVSLGTPKQDFAAQAIVDRAGVMAIGVGAGFDFLSGSKAEAPAWMQRTGLEWAFRLASEPGRLWRRYLFGNVWFLVMTGGQVLGARVLRGRARAAGRSGGRRPGARPGR